MHTPKKLVTGILVAAMVTATPSVVVPSATAVVANTETEVTQEQHIQSGTFTWGFRKSLVRYIEGVIAQGKIELMGPVTREGVNFAFPIDTANSTLDAQGNGKLVLQGGVHFLGHYNKAKGHWDLDVTLSNLFLEVNGTDVTVKADFVTKGNLNAVAPSQNLGEDAQISGTAVPLATFSLEKPITHDDAIGSYNFVNQDTAVTAEGFKQAFLNDKYRSGTPVDGPNLTVTTNAEKPTQQFGKESSVDSENRTGVIVGSVLGGLALIAGILAALKHFGPQFGIRLPF